jgi:SAM-dependent methyltransferase
MLTRAFKRARRALLRQINLADFDRRYGTDTTDFVPNENLAVISPNLPFGIEYQPTPPGVFRRMMQELKIEPENFTFIDFGCGKGRTLLLAAQAGFRRVIGLDYSPKMLEAAQKNLAIFQARTPLTRFETTRQDAVDFALPDGNCVLFFYNPFNEKVMGPVVENLRRSHSANPRRIYVILYNCAKQYPLFDSLPFLHRMVQRARRRDWLTQTICEWAVYGPPDGSEQVHGRPVMR